MAEVDTKQRQTKADIAVRATLKLLAKNPKLGAIMGIGSDVFDKLIEAAAEADCVPIGSLHDQIAYWQRYVDGVNRGII